MRQTHRITIPVLVLTLMMGAYPVLAKDSPKEGIVLPEGLWLFDIQVRMPMQSKPSVQKFKSCITSDPLSADTLMPWAESQGCKIRSVKVVEDKLTWKLKCNQNGQKSRGRGEFNVDGDQGKGKASVSFEMGGRRLTIFTDISAARVGACSGASDSELALPKEMKDSE